MIKNDQWYQITLKQIENFRSELENINNMISRSAYQRLSISPRLMQAQKEAIESVIEELIKALRDYEKECDLGEIQ